MKVKKVSKLSKVFKKITQGKGLYIALIVVVAMVGMGIYASRLKSDMNQNLSYFDEGAWQEAVEESGIEVIDIDRAQQPEPEEEPADVEPEQVEDSAVETNGDALPEEIIETSGEAENEFILTRPCTGLVVADCAIDRLVYCEAMKDWRTHNGVDVSTAEGEPVMAAEDGVVSKVYEDRLLGVVVEIDHQNGTSTLYSNLQSAKFILPGTIVEKGDIIGGVGKPGMLEANLGPHLHFEVKTDGVYCNPQDMIAF